MNAPAFKLDHDVAAELQVVEGKVDEELLAAHLEQELAGAVDQAALDLALLGVLGEREELERVGVLEHLAGEV